MNGFRRWLSRLRFFRHLHRRSYDRQAAFEFLFERGSLVRSIGDERSAPADQSNQRATMLVVGNPAPHSATRRDEFVLSRPEVPNLTITSDSSNSIAIVGTAGPDWRASFRAHGEGDSENEAQERARAISIGVSGGTIALTGPNLEGHQWRGDLLVEGPTDAGVVVHGSYAYVEVLDMAGSVRVSATHARAKSLDTTGQVDVTAGVIDFAGSIRVLVPPGFATPIQAVVSRRTGFVCRTELASSVKYRRQGELHIFSLGTENGNPPRQVLHLRSEEAAVVIDAGSSNQSK